MTDLKNYSSIKKAFAFIDKKYKVVVAVFFAIITLTGVLCFTDYGLPWDEMTENTITYSNMKEYVSVLAKDSDANKSLQNFPDISTYEEKDHGEAVYYIVPIYDQLFAKDNYRSVLLFRHLYTYLIFVCALFCLYKSLTFLTKSWKYGLLGCLFVFLSPRFFAENFYNNKDMILFSLVLISFWFGIKFIDTKRILYGCLFAVTVAFASNTRFIGFWLLGLVGLLYIISIIFNKEITKKSLLSGFITLATFVLTFFAITPATWSSPIEYFKYTFANSANFSRWSNNILFNGNAYNPSINPLPFYYIPEMIAITTPILIVIFIIFGHYSTIRGIVKTKSLEILKGEQKYYILLLLFIWVPLLFLMIKKSNVYNGWRHFYFIYGPLVILAINGVKYIFDNKKKAIKYIVGTLTGAQLILALCFIILNHPNQFAYYNILAINPSQHFELDYWNVSTVECIEKLVDETSEEKIKISASNWFSYDGLSKTVNLLPKKYLNRIEIIPLENSYNAEYIVSNPTYEILGNLNYSAVTGYELSESQYHKNDLVTDIKVRDVPIMEVYKNSKIAN